MKYQVTLFDKENRYKPVSCIIETGEEITKKDLVARGVQKICNKRRWTKRDLTRYGYLSAKVRIYDKEKIEAENKERYERIKKERGWI